MPQRPPQSSMLVPWLLPTDGLHSTRPRAQESVRTFSNSPNMTANQGSSPQLWPHAPRGTGRCLWHLSCRMGAKLSADLCNNCTLAQVPPPPPHPQASRLHRGCRKGGAVPHFAGRARTRPRPSPRCSRPPRGSGSNLAASSPYSFFHLPPQQRTTSHQTASFCPPSSSHVLAWHRDPQRRQTALPPGAPPATWLQNRPIRTPAI